MSKFSDLVEEVSTEGGRTRKQLADELNRLKIVPDFRLEDPGDGYPDDRIVDLYINREPADENLIQDLEIEGVGKDNGGFWLQTFTTIHGEKGQTTAPGLILYYKNGKWV